MANHLFREFDRFAREQARHAFRQSDAFKLVKEVKHAMNTPRRVASTASQFADVIQKYSRHGVSAGFLKGASRIPFGDMVREVIQYQASGGESARLVGQLLGAMGPMGRLLKSLLRSNSIRTSGLEGELDAAVQVLRAFAPHRLAPEWRNPATTGQVADSFEAAIARLEAEGYEVTGPGLPKPMREAPPTLFPSVPRVRPQKPVYVPVTPGTTPGRIRPQPMRPRRPAIDDPLTTEEQPFLPGGVPKTTQTGDRVQVELEGRRYPVTHPAITKEMVPVTSSNVHSIGYDYDSQTLYVRYLAYTPGSRGRGGPGSLYGYSAVSLHQFDALYGSPSKGVWLWDNIRIRGTWSGHRHDYRLVAIRNNYVPRKATYVGGGREKFVQRTVRVHSKSRGFRSLTSSLPEEYAPDLSVYGTPDRGEPNRGSPNRGR